jgi:hypothetical protein
VKKKEDLKEICIYSVWIEKDFHSKGHQVEENN